MDRCTPSIPSAPSFAFTSLRVFTRNTFGVIMRYLCGRGNVTYYRPSTHSSTRGGDWAGVDSARFGHDAGRSGAGTCSVSDSLGACVENFKFTYAH